MLKFFPDGNMQTQKRNQKYGQILLPFFGAVIIVTFLGYTLFNNIQSGNSNPRIWSDISVILLLFPAIVFLVIEFFLIALFISIAHQSQKIFVQKIDKIRTTIIKVNTLLKNTPECLAHPWIALESLFAIFTSNKRTG